MSDRRTINGPDAVGRRRPIGRNPAFAGEPPCRHAPGAAVDPLTKGCIRCGAPSGFAGEDCPL